MLLTPDQARILVATARRERFALLAVNADSHACVRDVLEAARAEAAPVIIETSLWQLTGRSYGAGDAALGMARYLADLAILAEDERYREVPVLFHTDHIKGPETLPLLTAAITGLPARIAGHELALRPSSVSLDSSQLSDDENLAHIAELCRAAERSGYHLCLEMEAGVDDGVTDRATAERLVGGCEAANPGHLCWWAPGLGSRHGFSDAGFPAFSASAVAEHVALAEEICGRPIGIALHGSSGLPEDALRDAVAAGVTKVNWSSESLLLRSQAARAYYAEYGERLEPGHPEFKVTAMDTGCQDVIGERYLPTVRQRIALLGGSGHAPRVLEVMTNPV